MPPNLFYTMVQKSQKWPKTQIKEGGGGPALSIREVFVVGSSKKGGFLVLCMWVGLEGM